MEKLVEIVDREILRAVLKEALGPVERPRGGRPRFDPVLKFKMLYLQAQHGLSFAATEHLVRDRLSWMRFCGLSIADPVPDANRVVKIGHAQDAKQRVRDLNKFRLSTEPQWVLHADQPIGSVQDTIEVEKYLGEAFAKYRTEPNNNEVYIGLDPMTVLMKLATVRR